ncbi:MAG: Pepco domain-containing protein [bacterium]
MSKAEKKTDRDPNEILFITRTTLAPGEVELHRGVPGETLKRTLDEVREDWKMVSAQVIDLMSATDSAASPAPFQIDEVSVSLGFNAKGKLAFLAEAGVESSITVSFKRRQPNK